MMLDRFGRLLAIAVLVPVLLLLGLAALLGVQVVRLHRATRLLDHTDVVLAHARDVEIMLLDQRDAARAFSLTGAEHLRERALTFAPETKLRQLEAITRDDARRKLLERASTECFAWQWFLRTQLSSSDPRAFIERSTLELAPLRGSLAAFVDDERRARLVRSEASNREMHWTVGGGVILLIAAGLALGAAVRRQLATVRSHYEAALAHERESQRTSEMFMAILGHDLRSPLAAVLTGSVGLMERGDVAAARAVHRAAQRMQRMIDDLLDLTRVRLGGGFALACKTESVGDLCRELVDEARRATPHRAFLFSTEEAVEASIDHDRLSQAISNLLSNAVTHGAADSPVDVAVTRVDGHVAVCVHNDGPPIPTTMLARLFDPFRGLETGRTRGLGLGLFIAERIVAAHGGSIVVHSSADLGTTFRVSLPVTGRQGGNP